MMIKDILKKGGYEVVGEAEDGLKAIEKYKELKPDLVTMDITMPEMDGITSHWRGMFLEGHHGYHHAGDGRDYGGPGD